MADKPVFRVGVAGLDARDLRLIDIVFRHSQYNRYAFRLADAQQPGGVDVLIANAAASQGQGAIAAARERGAPVIETLTRGAAEDDADGFGDTATREIGAQPNAIWLERLTLQLLPVLNDVVERELLAPVPASTNVAPVPASAITPRAAAPVYGEPVEAVGAEASVPGVDDESSAPQEAPVAPVPESTGGQAAPEAAISAGAPDAAGPAVTGDALEEPIAPEVASGEGGIGDATFGIDRRLEAEQAEDERHEAVAQHPEAWFEEAPLEEAPLEEAPLEEAPLEEAQFADARLEETQFEETQFEETQFEETQFEETQFEEERPAAALPTEEEPEGAQHEHVDVRAPAELGTTRAADLDAIPVRRRATEPQLRVLVVDDSPTVRRQLTVALDRLGLGCETVGSAALALERLEARHFDLALVDVVMPDCDGYKLTREIKRSKHLKQMPVIILTSRSSPFDLARGALSGCDAYLTKPVPFRALEAAVAKQLRRSLATEDLGDLMRLSGTDGAGAETRGESRVARLFRR